MNDIAEFRRAYAAKEIDNVGWLKWLKSKNNYVTPLLDITGVI